MKIISTFLVITIFVAGCMEKQKPAFIPYEAATAFIPGKEKIEYEMTELRKNAEKEYTDMRRKCTDLVLQYSNATTKDKTELAMLKNIADSATAAVNKFESEQQNNVWQKQMALTAPGLKILNNAIKNVCKKNGYSYVIDIAQGNVVYYDTADNILGKVKQEMEKMSR